MKPKRIFIFAMVISLWIVSMSRTSGASPVTSVAAQSTPEATQEATSATSASSGTVSKNIAYVPPVGFGDNCDLHLADSDGQNPTCISTGLTDDLRTSGLKSAGYSSGQSVDIEPKNVVKFSPDGSKILLLMTMSFTGDNIDLNHNTTSRLYVFDVAGGTPNLIVEDNTTGFPFAAAASPDGTLLAYTKPAGTYQHNLIFVSAIDGSSPRQLSPTVASYQEIVWSPDGKQILATANNQVFIFNATDPKAKPQTLNLPANLFYEYSSWSPDGQEILVTGDLSTGAGEPVYTLYRYTVSTKKALAVKVTPAKTNIVFAAWAPDQQKLLVCIKDPANYGQLNLYSMNPDGTGLQKLIDSVGRFDIAPDKMHIVYIDGSTGKVANLDGSSIKSLAKDLTTIALQP